MQIIRKHAALCALLAILAFAVAAPFMTPLNPDAAVFRYGTLAALLALAAYAPLRDAFARANLRTLICGMAFGLLFGAALSVGSELHAYDGLLPGMGSKVRRLAVPVLAAPLLGGLCMRVLLVRSPFARPCKKRISTPVFAAILLVCWLPVLLAYWPGMLNYDFETEYMQHVTGSYSAIHPLLHSAIMNGIISIGELLGSPTLGVLLMTLIQMILFALALGYACAFLQRIGAPRCVVILITALFALHPVFSVMAVSMTKDTLFAASLVVLTCMTWEMIAQPDAILISKRRMALYVLCVVSTALMRNNGVAALALILPGTLIAARFARKRYAVLMAASLASTGVVLLALNLILQPADMPSFQLYSLPAQQLVRAYNSDAMTEEEKAELRSWYVSEEGLVVHPHLGDPAKGYLDRERVQAEGERLLDLWQRVGKKAPLEYAEAFLMLNVGSWYPDDLSHATIYPDVSYNDKGYLQTQEYDMSEHGIVTSCFLPAVRDFYEKICRRNAHQDVPLVSLIFCTATPFWLTMLAIFAMIARRKTRLLPAPLGLFGLWFVYLFGPCTLPRYMLPLFALGPVLLIAALLPGKEARHDA